MVPVSARLVMSKVVRITTAFSINDELNKIPGLTGLPSLRQRLTLLDAVYRFAPELRLHPDDIYRPISIPLYLQNTRLRRHRPWFFDVQILDPGEVDVNSLVSQSSGVQRSGEGTGRTNFFLEIAMWVEETRPGGLFISSLGVSL